MERPDPSNVQAAVHRHHRRCLVEMISGRPLLLPQKQTTFDIPALLVVCASRVGSEGASVSVLSLSNVVVITLSSDGIILTAAVTPLAKSLELTIFLKSVAHGGGRLVSFGRTARSSTKDVSLSENCLILVFIAVVNDWRL